MAWKKNNNSLYPVFSASLKYITFTVGPFSLQIQPDPTWEAIQDWIAKFSLCASASPWQVMTLQPSTPPPKKSEVSSWWLNQPILKKMIVQMASSSPRIRGEHKQKNWKHHLGFHLSEWLDPVKILVSISIQICQNFNESFCRIFGELWSSKESQKVVETNHLPLPPFWV